MTGRRLPLLLLCGALLLAGGCAAGAEPPAAQPALDPAVAEPLAAKSEEIAAAYESGDVCTAAVRADELHAQLVAAINAGGVPPDFQEELLSRASELVDEVNCPPPPAETETDEDEDDDSGRGRGRDRDDDEDEEELPPAPPPFETETETAP